VEPRAPKPVRSLAGAADEPSQEALGPERAELEIDGTCWDVEVLGRSGGRDPADIPLLHLGFRNREEPEKAPIRHVLVIGRALAGLTELELGEALVHRDDIRKADLAGAVCRDRRFERLLRNRYYR